MPTYFYLKYDHERSTLDVSLQLYRTREEAESLRTSRAPAVVASVTIDAEPIYNKDSFIGWSLWSDGKIRSWTLHRVTPLGDDEHLPIESVPADGAISFIEAIRGSDSGYPKGMALGLLRDANGGEDVAVGPYCSPYARPRAVPWTLTFADGTTRQVFVATAGYDEGYQFDVYDTLDELMAANRDLVRILPAEDEP